jgi:hypothetical protein
MTELPDDMEGRLDHALNKAGGLMHEMNFVGTPNWHLSFDDLRTLLKAYQEQRWALGRSESLLRECLGDYGHPNFTDRYGMADRIRTALNQKGDER